MKLFGALCLAVICPASLVQADVQQQVESVIRNAGYSTSNISVAVRRCDDPHLSVDFAASTPRIPASNQKLLVSGLAARVLGPDFRFETRLLQRGQDLIVAGDGDPALGDDVLLADMTRPDGSPLTATGLLDLWASTARQSGVHHVDTLIIDDRVFDRITRSEGWPKNQLHHWYCAPVTGLMFSCNTMSFTPAPVGTKVQLNGNPPWEGVEIVNDMRVGSPGSKSSIQTAGGPDRNHIQFKGRISRPQKAPIQVCIETPGMSFGSMLAERLRHAGITVNNVRLASTDDPPPAGRDVAPPIVTPLATVLRRCNFDSHNLYADALFKRTAHELTGRPGTWQDGRRAMTRAIEQVAGPSTGLQISDGSGMSRLNAISARTMAAWLCSFDSGVPSDALFLNSISQPGQGKLANRFKDQSQLHGAVVRAKTGYLNGVYALSGDVICPNNHRWVFSILINNPPQGKSAKKLQEKIVEAIIDAGC